jgi:hypothetical protein
LRHALRPALLSLLFAAGSAQASSCISLVGYGDACHYLGDAPVERIQLPIGGKEVVWPEPLVAISVESRRETEGEHNGTEHRWTHAEAMNFVHDWVRRHHGHDFEEFRRHWHRGNHDGNGDGGCDDDLPRPVPLPAAALLFGPALLMLRAVQRRNA